MSLALQLNQRVEFGSGEPGLGALGQGWSHPEPGQVWSDGPEAVLRLSIDRIPARSRLTIAASPKLAEDLPFQRILIGANGLLMHSGRLGHDGTLAFEVPSYVSVSIMMTGHLELLFAMLDCRAAPDGSDRRQLGMALHSLELTGPG